MKLSVSVRLRPALDDEDHRNDRVCPDQLGAFDRVFEANTTQQEMFDAVVEPALREVDLYHSPCRGPCLSDGSLAPARPMPVAVGSSSSTASQGAHPHEP